MDPFHRMIGRAASIGSALLILSCRPQPQPEPVVVARVADRLLTQEEVSVWEASQQGKITAHQRAAFIRRWVEEELLARAAIDRGLEDDPWVQTRLDDVTRSLLTARLLEIESASIPTPGKQEIADYFEKHRADFIWEKPHLSLQYWRSSSKSALERKRRELTAARPLPSQPGEGAAIDTASMEIEDPARLNPTAYRLFGWLTAGQVGHPVYYQDSYWLFRVTRRDESGDPKRLEDVSTLITAQLMENARARRLSSLLRELSDEYQRAGALYWPQSGEFPDAASSDHPSEE